MNRHVHCYTHLARRYLIEENVLNHGWPLRKGIKTQVKFPM